MFVIYSLQNFSVKKEGRDFLDTNVPVSGRKKDLKFFVRQVVEGDCHAVVVI